MDVLVRKVFPVLLALALIYALWQLPAWDQGAERVPPDTQPDIHKLGPPASPGGELPPGHPPLEGGGGSTAASPGGGANPMELPLDELGTAELARTLARLHSEEERRAFEGAFRLTFTTDREARDHIGARSTFEALLRSHPNTAEAYRAIAYNEFNTTGSFPKTIALYEKAIELDADYGEAHYALSFMLTTSDRTRGQEHFDRAMALGIPDSRNLGERFYGGSK